MRSFVKSQQNITTTSKSINSSITSVLTTQLPTSSAKPPGATSISMTTVGSTKAAPATTVKPTVASAATAIKATATAKPSQTSTTVTKQPQQAATTKSTAPNSGGIAAKQLPISTAIPAATTAAKPNEGTTTTKPVTVSTSTASTQGSPPTATLKPIHSPSINPAELTSTTPEQKFTKAPRTSVQFTENPKEATTAKSRPQRPFDCSKFRVTSIPVTCCSPPKFQVPQKATDACSKQCQNKHCCLVECKYREMGIYRNKTFSSFALLGGYDVPVEWMNATKKSLESCDSLVLSPTLVSSRTLNPNRTTRATLKPAVWKFQKNTTTVATTPVMTTLNGTTASISTTTEAPVKERREGMTYCGIPIYVHMYLSCVRVQNYVNCPNFNVKDDACVEWMEFMRKCQNEIGLMV